MSPKRIFEIHTSCLSDTSTGTISQNEIQETLLNLPMDPHGSVLHITVKGGSKSIATSLICKISRLGLNITIVMGDGKYMKLRLAEGGKANKPKWDVGNVPERVYTKLLTALVLNNRMVADPSYGLFLITSRKKDNGDSIYRWINHAPAVKTNSKRKQKSGPFGWDRPLRRITLMSERYADTIDFNVTSGHKVKRNWLGDEVYLTPSKKYTLSRLS